MQGTLYIVATPIGNLEDVTLRALRILTEVDTIFCEDTRQTRKLLERHGVQAKLESMNARTEEAKINLVIGLLSEGKSVAYVSDAGTPGISDPGVRLVAAARRAGAIIASVPGPSALTAALSIAGVPTDTFTFHGFLPQKKGRQTMLKIIASTPHTSIVYESPHRIMKLLTELQEYVPERTITIARELTKVYEEVLQGSAAELLGQLTADSQKQRGEFVIIVST